MPRFHTSGLQVIASAPGRQISLRVTPEAFRRIDDLAWANRQSVSDYVRVLLHEHLIAAGFLEGLREGVIEDRQDAEQPSLELGLPGDAE